MTEQLHGNLNADDEEDEYDEEEEEVIDPDRVNLASINRDRVEVINQRQSRPPQNEDDLLGGADQNNDLENSQTFLNPS